MDEHEFPILDVSCTVEVKGGTLKGRCMGGPLGNGNAPLGTPGWNFEAFQNPENLAAKLRHAGEVTVKITLDEFDGRPDDYPMEWRATARLVNWAGQEYLASSKTPVPLRK